MISLIPLLWKRLEFLSVPCIAFSFWALAVLVHIKLQGGVIEPLVLGSITLCCMLLLAFVSVRSWKSIGTPALLLLAAIASYLLIASVVSLATDAELQTGDFVRQVFFLGVTLAAILGGLSLMRRIGVEKLLKWMLVALMASCAVIVATLQLRDIGVLPPEYRIPYRLAGTFTDPNDAGFIAAMTIALALALLHNRRQRPLAYAALALGYAAAFLTISNTAIAAVGVILTLYLLVNARRLPQNLPAVILSVLGVVGVLAYIFIQFEVPLPFRGDSSGTLPVATSTPTATSAPTPIAAPYDDIYRAPVRGGTDAERRVGEPIIVGLGEDQPHRVDDDPFQGWHWQRADARADDADVPNDATWSEIDRALVSPRTYDYTPTDADIDKFLRAYVYYEKDGKTILGQTPAIGPIAQAVVISEAQVSGGVDAERRVGEPIIVGLGEDQPHRADDDPPQLWHWQRADARADDADVPNDATWSEIDRALVLPRTYDYTPTDADIDKFLRAYIYYEKDGKTILGQTPAIGPIAQATVIGPIAQAAVISETLVVRAAYGEPRVGEAIRVVPEGDEAHRADDDQAEFWQWQRSNTASDDADWSDIQGANGLTYTPTDEDFGKFLRAYVHYERDGRTYLERTPAIGPIAEAAVIFGALVTGGVAEQRWVGGIIFISLVGDQPHRLDDDPIQPWQWQRSDAAFDDAKWSDIEGAASWRYTPTGEDLGKFLRAYVYYEKDGRTHRGQTPVLGPIAPSLTGIESARNVLGIVRFEKEGALPVRLGLWRMGAEKALNSPVFGHGLYQLHYMEGARIGPQNRPTGTHNLYLMLIGEAGIIPLALYLLALLYLVRLYFTMPPSLARDTIGAWVVVMGFVGMSFHHLLTQGTFNFLIGLTCAMAAFLVQRQRGQQEPDSAGEA